MTSRSYSSVFVSRLHRTTLSALLLLSLSATNAASAFAEETIKDANFYENLARVDIESQHPEAAVEHASKAIELNPKSSVHSTSEEEPSICFEIIRMP